MNLRKRAAFFSSSRLCACLALLTTSAALDLVRRSSSGFSSFSLSPAVRSSGGAAGHIALIADSTADHVGAAVTAGAVVCSSLLHGNGGMSGRIRLAGLSFSSLRVAATTAATAVAAHQLAAHPLRALAQSSDKAAGGGAAGGGAAGGGTPEPPPAGETFLSSLFGHLRSIEIPTFSAAVSRGVDRVASAVLLHFFPEAQLPPEVPPSPGSVFWSTESSSKSTVDARVAAAKWTGAATDSLAATGRRRAEGAPSGEVQTQRTAPPSSAEPAPVVGPAGAAAGAAQADRCRSRNSRATCSSNSPESVDPDVVSFSESEIQFTSQSALEDSPQSSFSASPSSSIHTSHSSSLVAASAVAQGQRVCPDASREQDTCKAPTADSFSWPRPPTPSGAKQAEFSSGFVTAGRGGRPVDSADAAAARAGEGQAQLRLDVAGGAARGGTAEKNSAFPSSLPAPGGEEGPSSGTAQPSEAPLAGGQPSGFILPFAGGEGLNSDQAKFFKRFFEEPANVPSASPFSVDIAGLREFLSSIDLLDPLLLALLGFHLLLLAGTLCCRRMHTVQLLLMSLVSTLLLCSKQLLLLCSLVEQRLRTDDSLASAIASFSSTPHSSLHSSSSSAAPQFYCCPSAAGRTTLFLLLFWWLPLFAALSLLVGTLVQELVASTLLLATRKAAVTKRRLRTTSETSAATGVSRPSPAAASAADNTAKM